MKFELNENDSFIDFGGNTRITEKCALVGYITQAYEVTAKTGAQAIKIDFTALNGKTASHSIYVLNKQGSPIDMGINLFKSILAVLDVKRSDGVPNTTLKRYDYDLKKDVAFKGTAHTAIMKKKIGITWDMVQAFKPNEETGEYDEPVYNKNGELCFNPEIQFFFDAETRQTAKEKQAGEKAEYLANWLERPSRAGQEKQAIKPPSRPPVTNKATANQAANEATEFDDYDDDIPF